MFLQFCSPQMVVPVPSSSVVPFRAVWTRAPKASGYLCVDSPLSTEAACLVLGYSVGLEPRRCAHSLCPCPRPSVSLAPVFPPYFAASCLRRPASPRGLLNVAVEGKVQNSGKGSSEIDHSWPRTGPLPCHPDQAAACQHWPWTCGAQQCPGHACSKGSS